MTQESPAEQLRQRGGIGGEASRERTGPPQGGQRRQGEPPRAGVRGGTGGGPPQRPPQGLPDDYLRGGYFDDCGNLRPELIVAQALDLARNLRPGQDDGIKAAQLRRFFGKARFIEQKLDAGRTFKSVVSEIHEFEPLAAYAVGRKVAPPVFKEIIDRNMRWATESEKAFRQGFLVHLESIVAYFTYLESQNSRRR